MMQVTYTNRKGKTYYLCQGVGKTGRPYYYFAREPKGTPVEQIPEGFEIRESVNGFLSLARVRPVHIREGEKTTVEAAIQRHPKAHNYRVDVKGKEIVVYERVGPDMEDLMPMMRRLGAVSSERLQAVREVLDEGARFSPEMRFVLLDEEKRTFQTERWCYLGSIDDWIGIGRSGSLKQLARRFVPMLGTQALFDIR
jgi:hypothetical protein